jgi:hypothetical protein
VRVPASVPGSDPPPLVYTSSPRPTPLPPPLLPFFAYPTAGGGGGGGGVGGLENAAAASTTAEDPGLTRFRSAVVEACGTRAGSFLVAAYSRQSLGQTGGGHYSPIGGYHRERDAVLIMDVARFKYPPHWVPLRALYAAMKSVDADTGRPRGYVTIRRSASVPLVLFAFGSGGGGNAAPAALGLAPTAAGDAAQVQGQGQAQSSCCALPPPPGSTAAAPSPQSKPADLVSGALCATGNCRGQGRSIAGAGDHLRTAALAIERAELQLERTPVAAAAAASLAAPSSRGGAQTYAVWQAAVAAAVDVLVVQPSLAAGGSSSSSAGASAAAAVLPIHVDVDAAAASSPPPAPDADGAQCLTRLSREQVSSAAALLTDLEATLIYRLVRRALERGKPGGASPSADAADASDLAGLEAAAASTPLSALMAAAHDHAGDAVARAALAVPFSDNSAETPAAAAGGTVASLVSAEAAAGGPDDSLRGCSTDAATCGHEAMSCVRVHTAHVVTMLLLTLYAGEGGVAGRAAAIASASASASPGSPSAAVALRDLVQLSLASASRLARAEVSLLRGQMDLGLEYVAAQERDAGADAGGRA